MLALLLPLLIGVCFVLLFLARHKTVLLPSSDASFMESVHSQKFSFGQLTYFDNLNDENKDQTPWVFIHSIGSSIYSWRFQIQHFSPSQRVIAVDLLGFGRSDKPVLADYHLDATILRIEEFLTARNVKIAHLVGCSLGGALCLWLKKLYPERFPKIVAIAPAAIPTVVPFMRLQHEKLAMVGRRIVSRTVIRAALRGGLANRQLISDETVENYFAPFKNPDAVTCFLKSVSIIKDPRLFEGLTSITGPLLILWGERDRVIPRAALLKITQNLPQARLLTHKTGGHHLMEDEPEWVNKVISDYFHSNASLQN
jgi:pimeloyl-ACP methyl ester carboxylesterase